MRTLIISTAMFTALASEAQAYIDPGSGSVLTTAIIGFAAAIAYTCRKYFYRAKDATSRVLKRKSTFEREPQRRDG